VNIIIIIIIIKDPIEGSREEFGIPTDTKPVICIKQKTQTFLFGFICKKKIKKEFLNHKRYTQTTIVARPRSSADI